MNLFKYFSNRSLKRIFFGSLGPPPKSELDPVLQPPTAQEEKDAAYGYDVVVEFSEGYIHENWYFNGLRHRSHGPAYTQYDADTRDILDTSYYELGKLHRNDGPAVRYTRDHTTREEYYFEGALHREDGPSVYEVDPRTGEAREERFHLKGVEIEQDALPRLDIEEIK